MTDGLETFLGLVEAQ